MRVPLCTLFLASATLVQVLAAQVSPPGVTANTAPFPISDDEISMTFTQIAQRAARLQPMLDQLHPSDWVAKGAADTYVAQWNSLVEQFRNVEVDMGSLAQHPGHLAETMKALFRLQSTHAVLDSLMGGTRKYQNPALADVIESVASENTGDVDRVERYLVQIALDKEEQLSVVDHEAQRCRATLSSQPAQPARATKKSQ
jgi:hypothetical protein